MRNINDAIHDWHQGKGPEPLHEYLGMSVQAYKRWLTWKMSAEELATFGYYDA